MNTRLHRSIKAESQTYGDKAYYLPNTFYRFGEEVIYNGKLFTCVSSSPTRKSPISSPDWDEIID